MLATPGIRDLRRRVPADPHVPVGDVGVDLLGEVLSLGHRPGLDLGLELIRSVDCLSGELDVRLGLLLEADGLGPHLRPKVDVGVGDPARILLAGRVALASPSAPHSALVSGRGANVVDGDAPLGAASLDLGELLGQADRRLRRVLLVGPALAAALLGLPHLALRRRAERLRRVLGALRGGGADLARRGPDRLLCDHRRIDRLAGALADVADGLAGASSDIADPPLGAGSDLVEGLAGPLSDVADSLAGALADVPDSLCGAWPELLERPPGAPAHLLDRLAALGKRVAGAPADVLERGADALKQLGVPVDGCEHAVDRGRDVIESHLQQRLGFDSLHVNPDLAKGDVYADIELEQVQHLRLQRDVRLDVLDVEMEPVELDDGDVQNQVGFVDPGAVLRVLQVLALRHGALPADIVGEAVGLRLLRGGASVARARVASGAGITVARVPAAAAPPVARARVALRAAAASLGHLSPALSRGGDATQALFRATTGARDATPGALADLADRLSGPLTDGADRLSGAPSDSTDPPPGAAAHVPDGLAGPLADVLDRAAGPRADLLDPLAGVGEHLAGPRADLLHASADGREELRVAIERQRHPVEDCVHVLQPRGQQRLRLYALDLELDLTEPGVGADAEVEQLLHRRHDGHLGAELVDLDVDLIDLGDRDVQQNVRAVRDPLGVDDGVAGILLLAALGLPPASRLVLLARADVADVPLVRGLHLLVALFAGLRARCLLGHPGRPCSGFLPLDSRYPGSGSGNDAARRPLTSLGPADLGGRKLPHAFERSPASASSAQETKAPARAPAGGARRR